MNFEPEGHVLLHHLVVMDDLGLLVFALENLLDSIWVLQEGILGFESVAVLGVREQNSDALYV